MKKIFCLIAFILISKFSFAQTYVGPVIGFDYSSVHELKENPYGFYFVEKGFVNKSPLIGFKLEQFLYKSLYFSYQFDYSKKEAVASDNGFLPIYGIRFNYLRNKFSLKYLFNNLIYIGMGWQYNIIQGTKFIAAPDFPGFEAIKESGIQFSFGIKYKHFDLELYYLNGLTSNRPIEYPVSFIKTISSIGIGLSYDFKIINKVSFKKATVCPRF